MTLECSVDCEERFHGCCTHPDGPDVDGSPMICEGAVLCGECPLRYSRDLVLDPFLGSGTTAIACLRTGRHFIGIEKHEPYFLKAQERIDKEREQVRLFDVLGGVTA